MIALDIKINGEPFVVAGVEDWDMLAAHIIAQRAREDGKPDEYEINTGGQAQADEDGIRESLRWGRRELKAGDEITIRLAETDAADAPLKRYRSDREVQENPFTEEEVREIQWNSYLQLKEKFEGPEAADKARNRE